MVKTVLRVQDCITLSNKLVGNIETLLGPVEVEYFNPNANHFDFSGPYQRKIDSLMEAFHTLAAHFPHAQATSLKKLTLYLRQYYQLETPLDQDTCEKITGECLGILMDVMEDHRNFAMPRKVAIELLNKAEQYNIMVKGRPNQATLGRHANGQTYLQSDFRKDPLHPETKKELQSIKDFGAIVYKYPEFDTLPKPLQCFLVESTANNLSDLQRDINNLQGLCRRLQRDHESISNNLLDASSPAWFTAIDNHSMRHLFVTMAEECHYKSNVIDQVLAQYQVLLPGILAEKGSILEKLQDIRSLPFWYYCLPAWEKILLYSSLQKLDLTKSEELYIPSRLRRIPALANYGGSGLYFIEKDAPKLVGKIHSRSAHIVSRDTRDFPEVVQRLHCRRNLEILSSDTGLFVGTLISPVYIPGVNIPDPFLETTLQSGIAMARTEGIHILHTNHPQNIAKDIGYHTRHDAPYCNELLANAKTCAAAMDKVHPIHALLEAYEHLLNKKPSMFSLRELYLSTMEHIICQLLNMEVHGTCVSGKDRYALLIIMLHSMWTFFENNGYWPDYDNRDDQTKLRGIFLTYFKDNHSLWESQYGADGAFGIKNLKHYLPADYLDIINTWPLSTLVQDKMASNNEVREIPMEECNKGKGYALMTALNYTPEQQTVILSAIGSHPKPSSRDFPSIKKTPSQSSHKDVINFIADYKLHSKDTETYVNWLANVATIPEEKIRTLLEVIHSASQSDSWTATNYMGAVISWSTAGIFSAKESTVPTGIKAMRNLMVNFDADPLHHKPLSVLTQVLFIAHEQLQTTSSGWGRDDKTMKFYQHLNALLTLPELSEERFELCISSIRQSTPSISSRSEEEEEEEEENAGLSQNI